MSVRLKRRVDMCGFAGSIGTGLIYALEESGPRHRYRSIDHLFTGVASIDGFLVFELHRAILVACLLLRGKVWWVWKGIFALQSTGYSICCVHYIIYGRITPMPEFQMAIQEGKQPETSSSTACAAQREPKTCRPSHLLWS